MPPSASLLVGTIGAAVLVALTLRRLRRRASAAEAAVDGDDRTLQPSPAVLSALDDAEEADTAPLIRARRALVRRAARETVPVDMDL